MFFPLFLSHQFILRKEFAFRQFAGRYFVRFRSLDIYRHKLNDGSYGEGAVELNRCIYLLWCIYLDPGPIIGRNWEGKKSGRVQSI